MQVDVRLNGDLEVDVRDDGRGLTGDPMRAASLGVLGMRECAAGLGGEVTLSSAPGKGTLVRASFPVGDSR